MNSEGKFTAYICIKEIYVGLNNSKQSRKIKKNTRVLFDGSTLKFHDSGQGMPYQDTWGFNAEYFYPSFQLAITNGYFVEDSNYKYDLEVSKNSTLVASRIKRVNFTGPGVSVSPDLVDDEIINVNVPGGGGGGGSGDQIISSSGYFNCDVSVLVGDLIYISSENTVSTSDRTAVFTTPTIGIVIDKPTPLTATVLFSGRCDIFAGLVPGTTYFLGPFGSVTATPPALHSGEVFQRIGVAISTTTLWIIFDPAIVTEVLV